jgi:hypothetical protein
VCNSADCSGGFPDIPLADCSAAAAVVAVVVDIDMVCAGQVVVRLENCPTPISPAAVEDAAVATAHQDYRSLTYIFNLSGE